jgi:hypothetical protein
MHKSASMFIHQICGFLSALSGIAYHSPNAPGSGITRRMLLTDKEFWNTRHGCFAPVRFFVDVPRLPEYRVILHVRDPRDVLVSMFYSYCFIHAGEVPGNTGYRKKVAEEGIDAFVLAIARECAPIYPGDYGTGAGVQDLIGNVVTRYRTYIDNLLDKPNVTLVKYEEMVTNFRGWLEKFTAPFPLPDRRGIVEQLVARQHEFFPQRGQEVMAHVRRVTPGDHRKKLKPETIDELNGIFGDVLARLGYE